ncbi:MAG TPA: phenylalanine--tRNA ligase subunit beta [Candidatus Saccharimonadales bacterium]
MKVSLNWIRSIVEADQCSANLVPDGVDALVEKIGAQLGAVEEVIDVGKKYKGIVVVKVVSNQKHPNADKLSVCLADDGGKIKGVKRDKDGLIEIVCGAPNVKTGMLAAWIPPGVAVPSTIDKEPLTLEVREIRGVVSHGMLASAKELELGDDHTGIIEIDKAAKPGDNFAKVYELDDYIIDIENKMFTHRPDCFGMLGIARELAGIQHMVFRSPKWYLGDKTTGRHKTDDKLLSVKNQVPNLVPRFMMQVVKNVKVNDASLDIRSYLARVGVRPINNIVDVTNFLMIETAQPIHAYDYDKLKSLCGNNQAKIVVREAQKGEKLVLLGGKEVTLSGGELVIATDKQPIGLAGVMGGAATEVDEKTRSIILEVGNFDMRVTRRTAMDYGLFTDAAARFTKNQSPWQTDRVLARAVDSVIHESGGLPARSIYDLKGQLVKPPTVKVTTIFVNERLGINLSASEMSRLLENVEFRIKTSGKTLAVQVPFWRKDIKIPEDIVEEIGRLYGYEHLPQQLPPRDLSPAELDPVLAFKSRMRGILSSAGANEVLTYSFVHGSLIENAGQATKDAYHIRNATSPDLQYYRLSLTPSLLEKVHPNIKARFSSFALFEIGAAHIRGVDNSEKLPAELLRLGLVLVSVDKTKELGAPFYRAKYYIDNLLNKLSIDDIQYQPLDEVKKLTKEWQVASEAYEPRRTAVVYAGRNALGIVGEPSAELKLALKLSADSSMAELDIALLQSIAAARINYRPLNRFPSLDQDLCLRSSTQFSYAALTDFLGTQLDKAAKEHGYSVTIEPLDIFQRAKGKGLKQTTWRLTLWHPQRTLTTPEVNQILDEISARAETELGAERV